MPITEVIKHRISTNLRYNILEVAALFHLPLRKEKKNVAE